MDTCKKISYQPLLLFITTFLFFSLISNLQAQWSTDPNNNLIVGYGIDPHICSDSVGGCYITYDYNSTSYPRWLALEKLDKYGYKSWGALKRILGELPEQSGAEIIEDGEGGVIVSYEDYELNWPDYTSRIRVQRVDSNGNFLWGPTGVKVTLDEINQGSQKIVNDGEGGAVVIWVNTLAEYKVNRISNEGQRMWGDSGIVLGVNGYFDPAIIARTSNNKYVASAERNTYKYFDEDGNIFYTGNVVWLENIISDGYGGILISSRGGQWPENWQLRAQRQDSLGNSLWQEPYIVVAESLYFNSRPSIQYNSGYYYFGWSGMKVGIDRIAQFQALRLDGSDLFPDGSISISNLTPLSIAGILPSFSSKTIFIWNNHPNLPDTTLTQLFDTLGNKLWDQNDITIAHPAISYQNYTTDGDGGFIIGGIINEFNVVAQQVSRNGNLGEIIPVPVELISFSGIVNKDEIILNWITATELNNYGFEILRFALSTDKAGQNDNEWKKIGFVSGYGTTTETKSYSFIDENVTTGLHKYRLKQIDFDGSFEYSKAIEINFGQPYEYILRQNYPNPFNSSTIIKYQIPREGRVRINLYNILGEKILTLFEGEQKAGEHEIKLTSNALPSGNYFYSLETDSYREVKKLTILK